MQNFSCKDSAVDNDGDKAVISVYEGYGKSRQLLLLAIVLVSTIIQMLRGYWDGSRIRKLLS
ncbi:hypothetical protein MUCCIDRAFT_88117 [Mucor lusitanicus CBS 277.49]|uniref:Uncharacterized protein n=1 Tax=Mucor lusitanicus CBS 277.49 TaxID=747725 RepID=A0A168MQK4_MUCCL|nr:hypothetical protein MUCCIDRAFT_88117 [Mucor lusitanicus CBS 277.49]